MLKGAIWEVRENSPSVIMSWHDFDGLDTGVLRVWMQSKSVVLNARKGRPDENFTHFIPFGSVSIQVLGNPAKEPTGDEKASRMHLAALEAKSGEPFVGNSFFRSISMYELKTEHEFAVRSLRQSMFQGQREKVKLVNAGPSSKTFSGTSQLRPYDYELEIAPRTTQEDSIVFAKLYSDLYSLGIKAIPKKLSEEWGVPLSTIHTAIKVARNKKWLTSAGAGKSGGTLTPLGEKTYLELNGPQRLKELQSAVRGN